MPKFRPFAQARVRLENLSTRKFLKTKKPMRVFVDTGSEMTLLSEDVLPAIEKLGPLEKGKATLHTANGTKEAVSVRGLSVCLEDVCHRGNMVVSGGFPGALLIGSDFLDTAKCSVDFKRKVIQCGKTKIPFEMEG